MKLFMVGPYYLYWHYTRGISELTKNIFNIINFELHFFSVRELLATFFAPFQRLKEDYGNNALDFKNIASALVVNIIMRLVGLCVRSVILFVAFIVLALSLILVPVILLLWLLLPLLLLFFCVGAIWAYLKYKP